MKIYEYNKTHYDKWNAFNKDSKNGIFMFDRDFMDYHSDRFIDNSLMFYDDNDKLIALLPCNIKDNILFSHQGLTFGGFIIDNKMKQNRMLECFYLLQNYMSEKSITKLIYKAIPYIYHKIPAQEDLYALFVNKAKLYRVDCSSTIDLGKQLTLSKGRKAQISRAKRDNVRIERSNDFKSFMDLLNGVLQDKHKTQAVHSTKELENLSAKFPNNINLWIATKDSQIIAGALIFIYENIIHTQYLAANALAKEIGGLDLLIKSLIDNFTDSKQYFDFGISNENNGLFLNEGLIAQKEGFGGRTIVHNFYEIINGGG